MPLKPTFDQMGLPQFQAFCDLLPFTIQAYTLDGTCVYANPAWAQFWGVSRSDIAGYNIFNDPHANPEMNAILKKAFLRGEAVSLPELDYDPARVGKSGRKRYFKPHFFPLKNEAGKVALVLQINEDLSDSRTLERAQKEAIELRDEFLSISSHELNTPLTALKLHLHYAKLSLARNETKFCEPASIHEIFAKIESQVAVLSKTFDSMLIISRLNSKEVFLEKTTFDLPDLVREVVKNYPWKSPAGAASVTMKGATPLVGAWDKNGMRTIVFNLLDNAVKYGGGSAITISVEAVLNRAILKMTDSGPGISAETLPRIFGRFERSVSSNEVSGLGLGLFIARQFAQAHGGSLQAESTLGKGTTFTLELPRL